MINLIMRIFLAILPLVTITNAAPPDVVNQEASLSYHQDKSPAFYEDYQEVTHMDFGMTFPLVSEDPAPWLRRVSRQVRWPRPHGSTTTTPRPDGNDGSGDHEGSGDQGDARDQVWYEGPASDSEYEVYRRPRKPSPKEDKKGKRTSGQLVKSSSNARGNRQRPEAAPVAGPSGRNSPQPGPSGLQVVPGTYVLEGPVQVPTEFQRYGASSVPGTGAGVDCRQCQGSDCNSCDNPGPRCHVLVARANEGRQSPRLFEQEERVIEYQQEIFDPLTGLPEELIQSVLTCCEDCPVDDCICSGEDRCEKFLAKFPRKRAFLEQRRKRSHRYVFGFSKKNWSDSKKFRDGEWTPEFHNTTTTTQRPDGGPPRRGSRGHRIELRNAPELARPTQLGRLFEALGIEPKPSANQYVDSIRDTVRSNPRWDNFEGTVEEYIWCLLQ